MARFLLANMPVPGHIAPFAPVARTLLERGHEVVWYGSSFFKDKIEASGASFRPITRTLDYGDNAYDTHFPERARLNGLKQIVFDFEHLFVNAIPGMLEDLREIVREFKPDVLLNDPAVAAARIMNDLGEVRAVTLNISVLGLPSRDLAPFGLGLLPDASWLGRARNSLMTWVGDHLIFRPVNRRYRELAAQHGWPIFPFRPGSTDWLYLQPGAPELEYPRFDLPPQVHFIGPLLPETRAFVPPLWWPELEAARRAGKKVVLVTQGTIATDSSELIEPALRALSDESLFVIAAGADPARIGDIPANAHVVKFMPFVPLMPMVDAYLTNGGYGGVSIALAHGVPVVSGGTTEDKSEVGNRVAFAGVGINLKTNRPTPEQLRQAVRQVLGTPSYRERARAVRRALERHDAPERASELLERLVATGQPVHREASAASRGSSLRAAARLQELK